MKVLSLDDAILFAAQAHKGQLDKAGKPYILHPLRVMLALQAKGAPVEEQMAAVLHDVIEDCHFNKQGLMDYGFDERVAQMVDLVSRHPGQTYNDYIDWLVKSNNHGAMHVKMADLEDNMSPARQAALKPDEAVSMMQRYQKSWFKVYNVIHGELGY